MPTDSGLAGAAKQGALLSGAIGVLVVITARGLGIVRVHPEGR